MEFRIEKWLILQNNHMLILHLRPLVFQTATNTNEWARDRRSRSLPVPKHKIMSLPLAEQKLYSLIVHFTEK